MSSEPPEKGSKEGGRLAETVGQQTLAMLAGVFEMARVAPHKPPSTMLPLTIISGFLGAGKTTLVNRLLSAPENLKIAVLVNDFAAINIDEELIRFQSNDVIGLTNGCACCATNGDLVNAIHLITSRTEPPDAVVLEASGLADPRGIAQVALAHPAMRLDGVITLIDCESFPDRLADERTRPTLLAQLSAADIVALSKSDLMGERRGELMRLIESAAPGQTIVEMTHGDIPPSIVLGASRQVRSASKMLPKAHGKGFASTTRTWRQPLDRGATLPALRELPAYVIRAKGVFCFNGDDRRRHVYQRVGRRESLDVVGVRTPAEHGSRLVVIGFEDQWNEDELLKSFPTGEL